MDYRNEFGNDAFGGGLREGEGEAGGIDVKGRGADVGGIQLFILFRQFWDCCGGLGFGRGFGCVLCWVPYWQGGRLVGRKVNVLGI